MQLTSPHATQSTKKQAKTRTSFLVKAVRDNDTPLSLTTHHYYLLTTIISLGEASSSASITVRWWDGGEVSSLWRHNLTSRPLVVLKSFFVLFFADMLKSTSPTHLHLKCYRASILGNETRDFLCTLFAALSHARALTAALFFWSCARNFPLP